jgi:two-component system response regulator YesN
MKKIIIVEDEMRIRTGLVRLIDRLNLGARVIGEAGDGVEGLRLIQDMEPDIVITDIQMPRLDGLEMIRIQNGQHTLSAGLYDLTDLFLSASAVHYAG